MPSDALMYMNWQQMIKPEKVQVTSNPTYGKFVCEPLERGFHAGSVAVDEHHSGVLQIARQAY